MRRFIPVAALALLLLGGCQKGPSGIPSEWNYIRKGMTKPEVEGILGQRSVGNDADGNPMWETSTHRMTAILDKDGKVTSTTIVPR